MTTRPTDSQNTLHARIMQRLTPLLVAMFVLAGVVAVVVIETRGRLILEQQRVDLINDMTERVNTYIGSAIVDILNLSSSAFTRDFYEVANDNSAPVGRLTDIRSQRQVLMLRAFNDLVRRDSARYLGVRYLTRDNQVWGEITNINNQTSIDTTYKQRGDRINDGAYNQAISAQAGREPVLGPSVRLPATSELYVPVFVLIDNQRQEDLPRGLVQLNLALRPILDQVASLNNTQTVDGRRVMLLDRAGNVLITSGGSVDRQWLAGIIEQNSINLDNRLIDGQFVSMREVAPYGGGNLPWRLILLDDYVQGLMPQHITAVLAIVLIAILGLTAIQLSSRALSSSLRPVTEVSQLTGQLASRGHLPAESLAALTENVSEIQQVITDVSRIADQISTLEQRLQQQTRRRSRDIEVASRIGRETATLTRIDDLLNRAIDLICSELGFYHAQVFLVDDIQANALLVYSHGEAGQKLLAQKHKLAIGSDTVIGRVTGSGAPVIVNDTQQPGQPFGPNPLLPDTRAELGLPLMIGNDVIGALDIQSLEPNVFHEEDLPTFRLLADQIAIAVNKARLVSQSELRIQQINTLNRQLTRMGWESAQEEALNLAFRYDLSVVSPYDVNAEGGVANGQISIPITIRGEVVGVMNAQPLEGQTFTQGDQVMLRAVADRVALALENARLFQETQNTLAETSILYQLSRHINQTATLEGILNAILVSVMTDAGGAQVWIFDDYEIGMPELLTLRADVAIAERDEEDLDLVGLKLRLQDHPFLRRMHTNQVALIYDTRMDNRLDAGLQLLFRRMNARAVVAIPLPVRGTWMGLITVEFEEPRVFTEREGRIFEALIDQAAVAIDNRLLLERTESAVALNENLYAASRIINTAQSPRDLVHAAVATTNEMSLDFALALLEGDLELDQWPNRCRIVARSRSGVTEIVNVVSHLSVVPHSPMLQREPETIEDGIGSDGKAATYINWLEAELYPFAVVFPLFSANHPIALFLVMSYTVRELPEADYDVYRALTGQMSTQIQNTRLLEQTQNALDEQRRLYLATRAIASAQDSRAVYETTSQHLRQPLMDYAVRTGQTLNIAILLGRPQMRWDAPQLECVYVTTSGSSNFRLREGMIFAAEEAPFGQLALEREDPLYLPDVMQADDTLDNPTSDEAGVRAFLRHIGATSAVVVPIQSRQQYWYGTLIVQSTGREAFSEGYIRFLNAVAGQLALAVENRKLFEDAQTEAMRAQLEARRAFALAEAAQLANQVGMDFDEGLADVLARVAEAGGYDRWQLALMTPQRRDLHTVVLHTPDGPLDPDSVEGRIDALSPLSLAVEVGRSLVLNRIEHFPAYLELDENIREQYRARYGKSIVTPVRNEHQIIGALLLGRAADSDDLDDGDERLVSTLTSQVALALENRRLFRQAESERQTLRSILSTLPAAVVVFHPDTLQPITYNEQAELYMGDVLDRRQPFSAQAYGLYRTNILSDYYPDDELPVRLALLFGEPAAAEDVLIRRPEQELYLLINAAPITDEFGETTGIVTSFTDISSLRVAEGTLQATLYETTLVYEFQRQLTEARDLREVLDVTLDQLLELRVDAAYILMTREETGRLHIERASAPHALDDVADLSAIFDDEEMLYLRDLYLAGLPQAALKALEAHAIGSLLSIPLRSLSRDLPIGWMLVTREESDAFSLQEQQILSQFGDIASTAVENRILMQSTAAALSDTAALYSANTSISRARDFNQLSRALQAALQVTRADLPAAFLSDTFTEYSTLFAVTEEDAGLLRAALTRSSLPEDGLFIDNLYAEAEADGLTLDVRIAAPGLHALAVVPMRVKNNVTGWLVIGYNTPHYFSEGERRYMRSVSDSASVVLDNLVLVEEISSTLNETTTLYEAGRKLNESRNPQDILDIVLAHLAGPYVDQVFIALLEASAWHLPKATIRIIANWQSEEVSDLSGMSLSAEQFPLWASLSSPVVMTVDDVARADDLDEIQRMGLLSIEAQSFAVIPLRVPNRVIGAIWISSHQPHYHTEAERRIFRSFSEQASLTMEAAYLLQQTERRARQLETSAQVSNTIGQILELNDLLPLLVNLIRGSFNYDHVQIFLMDEQQEYAVLRASTGDAGRMLLSINHRLQKGSASVIGQVVATGQTIVAFDTEDTVVVHRPNPYLPLTRSEIAIPLIVKEVVIGALDVQSNQPNAFTQDDERVLAVLAGQIAVAIDNANLYAEAQTQASRMSLLFNITKDAANANTLPEALTKIVHALQTSQQALTTAIYLVEEVKPDARSKIVQYSQLRPAALAGSNQPLSELEITRLDDETRLLSRCAVEMRPINIPDINQERGYFPVSMNARSALLAPMVTNQLIGVIVMESASPNAYQDDEVQLLQTLAGSVSATVQSAQLIERLNKAYDDLLELDRIKSDFLANMSHELRTPLNSIIGFSRVMLKGIDGPLTEMQEQDLTTIYTSGQHLLMLINDILDQAKIAAGKMDMKFAYFDAKPMIEGVRSIGIGLIKDKPINLTVEISPSLPKAYGDEFRTRQVLINLVSNATKFTHQGTVTIRAYAITQNMMEWIRVDVIDTGIGIAESDLPLLFEEFQQVDSSLTRTAGGTGLGLPIARSLIEMQGGAMMVESQVNVGSTFSILIPTQPVVKEMEDEGDESGAADSAVPLTSAPEVMPALETRTVPRAEMPQHHHKMPVKRQILLIEDNPDMVDQFRRALQREGFDVLAATIPLEAEAMASGLRPTLIVMDVNFANGAGWDMLARLKDRDDTFDIPIIIVTLSDESERAYQAGAFRFIQRPFVPEDLVEAALQAEKESNTERILIIDDQPDSVRLLTQLLDEHGQYRVFYATNGDDGIALVARRRPDLVILDLRMPGKDGFAVLNELRSNPETSAIPVMVVTGEIDFNASEQQQLSNVRVLPKTDISQEEYDQFIIGVQRQLNGDPD